MTAIPGVLLQKDANGQLTHVQIDVQQHREAIPVLEELGLLQAQDTTAAKGQTAGELHQVFMSNEDTNQWNEAPEEEGHTIAESKAHIYSVIRQFYESNHQ